MSLLSRIILLLAAATAQAASASEPSLQTGTVMEAAERLRPGEFLWAPDIAPQGPVLLVVSLATQRAVVYRNGIPIGITTVSTGRDGYRTPTGVFTILQKRVEHYSNLYNNAPMPYMQRLTWGGVALHAGNLPGYPASHGCIRLPHEFAQRLYGVTHLGMTVVVTNRPAVPRVAPAEALLQASSSPVAGDDVVWQPQRSPSGPVSIVVSSADRRVVVLRNGAVIGSAPVDISGAITRASAFTFNRIDGSPGRWLRIGLPGQTSDGPDEELRGRISVPESFRRDVEAVIASGTTVVVTPDSLRTGGARGVVTVIEDDRGD